MAALRAVVLLSVISVLCFIGAPADAQQAAARPITLVVPYAPGGGIDYVARQLASRFESQGGQKMIVENRTGAGGYTGSVSVARSAPDGQTLLANFPSSLLTYMFDRDLSFDFARSIVPVALLGISPQYLFVSTTIPAKNLQDVIAYAKRNPKTLNAAAVSKSVDHYMYMPQVLQAAGIEALIVPYNSMADAVRALVAGQVHLLWTSLTAAGPHLGSGKLVALGVRSTERSAQLPEAPTFREQGVNFDGSPQLYTIYGPAGLAPELIGQLNQRINVTMKDPSVHEALTKSGAIAARSETPAELAVRFEKDAKEIRDWAARKRAEPGS